MHQLVLVSISKDEEVLDGGNVMMEKGLFPCKLIFFDGVDSMKLQFERKNPLYVRGLSFNGKSGLGYLDYF